MYSDSSKFVLEEDLERIMNFSYWERNQWFENLDVIIIGSGIVGLSTAIHILKSKPHHKVLILEKGILPQGGSTKNAGFACFGSLSELIHDLDSHSPAEVIDLIRLRWEGLNSMRTLLGDEQMGYECHGGYELFLEQDLPLFNNCREHLEHINKLLLPVFNAPAFVEQATPFGFGNVHHHCFFNPFEGQIDTGKMMDALIKKAIGLGAHILTSMNVNKTSTDGKVYLQNDFEIQGKKIIVATNGFANQLLNISVVPARAQVLITHKIKNLAIKGTFHMDKGYYYFRNINDRILFGGGRQLDLKRETTSEFGLNAPIQETLSKLLKSVILPQTPFEIDDRWSGIMGVGNQKIPLIKIFSDQLYCGVRLGGMGVAMGNLVGKKLAETIKL